MVKLNLLYTVASLKLVHLTTYYTGIDAIDAIPYWWIFIIMENQSY